MGILSIFSNKHSETLTYFIPAPPQRQTGYREKELDTLTSIVSENGLSFELTQTVPHTNGFWAIIVVTGTQKQFDKLYQNERFQELDVNQDHAPEVELIHDNDEEFQNLDIYKI